MKIRKKIGNLGKDKLQQIVEAFISDLEQGAVAVLEYLEDVENPEFLELELDDEEKIISFTRKDGSHYVYNLRSETIDALAKRISVLESGAGSENFENIEDPEGRLQLGKDSEDKIFNYRKPDGTLVENAGIETNHLELTEQGMNDFQQALKDSGFRPGGAGDYSDTITEKGKNPVYIPTPRCAYLNIISDIDLTKLSKSDRPDGVQKVNYDVKTQVEFFDGQGIYFRKWTLMSAQGNSSMAFVKKNLSFKFFDTEDVEGKKKKWGKGDTFGTVFGDWVMQKTYHLKAYYTDFIRGSSVIAYQLADKVYKTRGVYADRPWKQAMIDFNNITSQTPGGLSEDGINDMNLQIDNGARCMPDGFPVIVYQNGEFYGIFSWQLKKDAANFNMDEGNPQHIHIDGDLYNSNLWGGTINWTAFEIRNPEGLVCMDGSDYNGDFPAEIIDATSEYYDPTDKNHVNTAMVKQAIINLSNRISEIETLKTTDMDAAKAALDTYFDIDNLVDYEIINMACGDTDGFGKNWQWTTWDGVKWFVNQYDKDMALGNFFNGMFTTPPRSGWIYTNDGPIKLSVDLCKDEHIERWKELYSSGILSKESIKSLVTEWVRRIGVINYLKEWEKWPESPCNRDSGINFENWEFTGEYSLSVRTPEWDAETEYSSGDNVWFNTHGTTYLKFTAVQNNVNEPPLTQRSTDYPVYMGYRDSIWRYYKYIEETIENQNSFINSL